MKIAIYSRKSKFTGKGDSVQNQVDMCKAYCEGKFEVDEYLIYEDEGFSGGSTDRPRFRQMIKDAVVGLFQAVVCYRLDRISRNVSDFSATLDILNRQNIAFVSITEQFDTSTPMGRAMTYIASVFAQLERETIADRIRDNMQQLAKGGRWLGGVCPTGFKSEPVETTDKTGRHTRQFRLAEEPAGMEKVKIIYSRFMELNSLAGLETYLMGHDILTPGNRYYTRFSLRAILTNPVYAVADGTLYDYFIANGYEVYAARQDFDGLHGVMAYNKTIQKKHQAHQVRSREDWIIAVGAHRGVIPSPAWIKVQQQLEQNRGKTYRKARSCESLLSGLLRCGRCGSYMRPKVRRADKTGKTSFSYVCELKEASRKKKCDCKNAVGAWLDQKVVNQVKLMPVDLSQVYEALKKESGPAAWALDETVLLENTIRSCQQEITRLLNSLARTVNENVTRRIMKQVEECDAKLANARRQLQEIRQRDREPDADSAEFQALADQLTSFSATVDALDTEEKRTLLKSLALTVLWDGSSIRIGFNGGRAPAAERGFQDTIAFAIVS